MSRESRSKSSESHARTKFANSQLSNMLKSHILTQNHCEYALTTLEEPPENIKLPRTAEISKPTTPVTKLGKSNEENPKSAKQNKAEPTKNLRKSARNVEKQKKEMEKKAEEEKTEKGPERTKIEYSGINKFRFGSGSNPPVSPTTPTKTQTKLQDTNKTANMQNNAPAKVQNNQLLLTPPKNLRKLSKDYSPNSIEK